MSDVAATATPDTDRTDRRAPEPVAVAEISRRTLELTRRVALSECTVLLVGASGTGKEVLARYIHRQSARASGPFIAVNCAALPESMLEAILFGYERGAFTGAVAAHPGKFEQAQHGTLLLDEVTEMPIVLQAKLLRVLQEREVERLGGRASLSLDVRVIATTNRRLREEVAAGRFREDLFYRLNVFPLQLAPLHARREDILPLAMQLLSARCPAGGRIPALSAQAGQLLLTYPWPGNVRELDNVLQRALILMSGPVIRAEHIQFESPAESAAAAPMPCAPGSLAGSLGERERETILAALRSGKNRNAAAQSLGISARTLRYKLARLREAGVVVPTT
jgi:two-component system, response regulator FlrC